MAEKKEHIVDLKVEKSKEKENLKKMHPLLKPGNKRKIQNKSLKEKQSGTKRRRCKK